ncbi:MAG: hypothetical protein GXP62_07055 [Oligoflexia bacterium]|nr:hypothetical protein [Oligoflexia bacterium]
MSRAPRWLLIIALMTTAVLLATLGHKLLAGVVAMLLLLLSALSLSGLIVFLFWAYQGDVAVRGNTVLLPHGLSVPRQRLRSCSVENDAIGGVLVLDLDDPAERRRVPTGQPHSRVVAFAQHLIRST